MIYVQYWRHGLKFLRVDLLFLSTNQDRLNQKWKIIRIVLKKIDTLKNRN